MILKYLKTILESQDQINEISGVAWSPNQQKLAVATAELTVILFDINGDKRDKFATKPGDPNTPKNGYIIRSICFSPDSTKLAIAQSDNFVFVYKLGVNWNEKKVICNKFPIASAAITIIWLGVGPIIAGCEDGKVLALNPKSNKSQHLYGTDNVAVSLAANELGTGFLCGHDDGTIMRFFISNADDIPSGKIVQHHSSPVALAWANGHIVAAGCDKKVAFYDAKGHVLNIFDYTRDRSDIEFNIAAASANGRTVAIGSFNKLRLFTWNFRQKIWTEMATKEMKNLYSMTALAWKQDSSRLAIGSLCGSVLIFEAIMRRTVWRDKYEVIYVSPNHVLIKPLTGDFEPVSIISKYDTEIDDVRIMGRDCYLIARTDKSLIISDLTRNLTSEVTWMSSGAHEKFYFENPNVCLIFNAGELTLIEYGENIVLSNISTEFYNPHLISVRINERGTAKNNKKVAYLLDMKTICVFDLITNNTIAQITHNTKIDWLELNEVAVKLLFRDKKMRLFLVDVETGTKQTLLVKVSFVQWVIQSDVVVAQTGSNVVIWYNIDMADHLTTFAIQGDVAEIVREQGKSKIITREGTAENIYYLDEGLVEIATAVNDNDVSRAVQYLESLDTKYAAKAIWLNLANITFNLQNLKVAQRCYAAQGSVSKAFQLSRIADEYDESKNFFQQSNKVRANLALVNADFRLAEKEYLEQGDILNVINMYQKFHRWNDAIKIANRRAYSDVNDLRENCIKYFLKTNQEEKAGELIEEYGDVDRAMKLYLKAKQPTKAARLILKTPQFLQNDELVNQVANYLIKCEMFELAADLYKKLQRNDTALALYRKSGSFSRAIDLARHVSPEEVTVLEEEWGDWLVSRRQLDASISHYIEGGATNKALDSAASAKQWYKAIQIASVLDDPSEIKQFAVELTKYLSQVGDIEGAEHLLVRAEMYEEAVDILNKHGHWEKALNIAKKYLSGEQVSEMFTAVATKLEQENKVHQAAEVYLAINYPDQAISMYKRQEQYEPMMELVDKYHKEHTESTHLHLANELKEKRKYKLAENHYIMGNDWKGAVHMYCGVGMWEQAYKLAKGKGNVGAANQVVYMWCRTLSMDGAARLLTKMDLVETVVSYACDMHEYEFALEICHLTGKSPDDVHLKIAMDLEDEEKFAEAEVEFLLANKPKEAILMYTHNGNWSSALQIADKYMPEKVSEVLILQAAAVLETRNYPQYEALLIRAERPDILLHHYREYEMWNDAIRIAKTYAPSSVDELHALQSRSATNSGNMPSDSRFLLQQASEFARKEEFRKSVDCLLEINEGNAEPAMVERALTRAAEICNQFLEGKDSSEIARQLAPRLNVLNKITQAAQLYLAAEMPRDAVDIFINSENWNKARRLAKEIDPKLVDYVDAQQKSRLRSDSNIEQLADIDVLGALDLLAEQGQWSRCIEKAKQINSSVMHKYLAKYAAHLIHTKQSVNALNLYLQYGSPGLPQNYNIYTKITLECFSQREEEISTVWKDLRTFLFQVVQAIKDANPSDGMLEHFQQLLLIAHYYMTRTVCRQVPSLNFIAIKISVALLRYTDLIPVDKGFFEAGMDLRAVGRESEAFILINHYLDVCEAIEEDSGMLVDHSDLTVTDFPSSVPIPELMHLANEQQLHEEIREWILAVSMDQKIDQVLPTDDRSMYESSLGLSDEACIVSGYPVLSRAPVSFTRSKRMANSDIWSKFNVAAKMSPHSGISEIIEFIEKWNGSANI